MVAKQLGSLQGELGQRVADVGLQACGHLLERREQFREKPLPGRDQGVGLLRHIQRNPAFVGIHHRLH